MNLNLRQCRVLPLEEAAGTGGWGGHREPAPQGPSPPEGRWRVWVGSSPGAAPVDLCAATCPWPWGSPLFPHVVGSGPQVGATRESGRWPPCGTWPGQAVPTPPAVASCASRARTRGARARAARLSPSIPSRVGGSPPPSSAGLPAAPWPPARPLLARAILLQPHRGRARTWTQRRFLPRVGPRLPPACVLLLRMCSCCPSNHTNSASCLQLTPRASGTGAGGPR